MHKCVTFPDSAVKTLMLFGEIRFHGDQKYGHAGQDEQIGEKNGKIVNDGSPQRTNHCLGSIRHEPEDELIHPYRQIVKGADRKQAIETPGSVEKIEFEQRAAGIFAHDVMQKRK